MSQGLDWTTPSTEISLRDHWRILISIIVGAGVSFLIWHLCFPHVFPFMKFWAGFATGATVGLLVGAKWQLKDESRRAHTSGRFLAIASLAWGFFAIITFLWLMPSFISQERERAKVRHLEANDISSIEIQFEGKPPRVVASPKSIREFVERSHDAELFYPSHEGSIREFKMTIVHVNGESQIYEGRIPKRHQRDISLRFWANAELQELIVPEGRHWLETALE